MLADDHILLRDALSTMVNSMEGFLVINMADNGEQVLEALRNNIKPDLILLDLNMPVMDGFQCARIIGKEFPDQKIVILTMYDSEIALIRLLQDGVRGFLKKDIQSRELKSSLIKIMEGGYCYSSDTTGKLGTMIQSHFLSNTPIDRAILNDREITFLKLACSDMTYKEIAAKMNLTPRMVDCCRDLLFEKLDVKNRVGLALYAIKHGLVCL